MDICEKSSFLTEFAVYNKNFEFAKKQQVHAGQKAQKTTLYDFANQMFYKKFTVILQLFHTKLFLT
jgi:hypothetical protein